MFKIIVLSCLSVGFVPITYGQETSTKEETNIYEKITDAQLQLVDGRQPRLSELYSQRPLLLAFIYTRCSGVCTPFLLQLKEDLQFANDSSFRVLVLSFDPSDSLESMARLSKRDGLSNNKQWLYGIVKGKIAELEHAVSFNPQWDSLKNQFDHDALLVGINREGYITKKLIGIRGRHDLNLMIASVNNIFSPTYRLPVNNTLFSCFNYDPSTGKNTPGLGLLFIVLPSMLSILLFGSIRFFVRKGST